MGLNLLSILINSRGGGFVEALKYNVQESIDYYFNQLSNADQAHCLRVEALSLKLANAMNLPKEKHGDLALAARYHDVGKVKIPKRILEKPSNLTKEERQIIMVHSKFSSQLLEQTLHSKNVIRFALLHHENMDGTGYPFGYKGFQIPFEARIIRVADAYDALHSKRAYKDALPMDGCLLLLNEDGPIFDQFIIKFLCNAIK